MEMLRKDQKLNTRKMVHLKILLLKLNRHLQILRLSLLYWTVIFRKFGSRTWNKPNETILPKFRQSVKENLKSGFFDNFLIFCVFHRWKSLVGTFDGRLDGAYNEMDLIAARGAAEYHDFDNPAVFKEIGERNVCEQHRKELIDGLETYRITHILKQPDAQKDKYKCGMPAVVSPHPKRTNPKVNRHILTRDEAKRVLNDYHVHVHVGTRKLN